MASSLASIERRLDGIEKKLDNGAFIRKDVWEAETRLIHRALEDFKADVKDDIKEIRDSVKEVKEANTWFMRLLVAQFFVVLTGLLFVVVRGV